MDVNNYEELQESVVFYRTHFCKKVMEFTTKELQLKEREIKLDSYQGKMNKVHWKYDPKISQGELFPMRESINGEKIEDISDSENLTKVKKMLTKIKCLKEVTSADKGLEETPYEVLLEKLRKEFGVQIS